jgi:flagellar biosynthesis anti-sigma factor FlgM
MTVNINTVASVTPISATRAVQAGKIAPADTQPVQLPQDHATVSAVGDLVAAALKQPEVRTDKVAALKAAVSSGTYKVDPDSIASSMLADQG